MKTIFISTYNELITIALLQDGKIISQKEQLSNNGHSTYLVPLIDTITKENGIKVNNLDEVIVINGPGSFTGIRLGITVAKTLAYTLNIPIKTISSIEAIAAGIKEKDKIVTINDNKGAYIGIFKDNNLSQEMVYLKNEDINAFLEKYQFKKFGQEKLDIEKIYEYSKIINPISPHSIKAIYIKEIEALNGR